jgi:hypothetical protein
MPRRFFLLCFAMVAAVTLPVAVPAATPPLLTEAFDNWAAEIDGWAFTQRVRTFDNDKVKLERLERYDPSRPDNERWELLEVDGKPPTAEQRETWEKRKHRKAKRKPDRTIEEYFDFPRATVASDTGDKVSFNVPVRRDITRLVSLDKIEVEVTVNKRTRSIQQITGGLKEPLRVALGLAKVTDGSIDVRFKPIVNDFSEGVDAATISPSGTARVVLFRMGDRAEYAWSDFKRVTPFAGSLSDGLRVKIPPRS